MFRTTQSPRGPEGIMNRANCQSDLSWRRKISSPTKPLVCTGVESGGRAGISLAQMEKQETVWWSPGPTWCHSRFLRNRETYPDANGWLILSFLMLQNGPGGTNTHYLAPLKLFSAPLLSEYWLGDRTFQLGQCYLKNEVLVSVDGKDLSVTHFSPFKQLVFQRN